MWEVDNEKQILELLQNVLSGQQQMQNQIGSIQENIGSIQENIGNIQENIGNIQEEIESINGRLSKLEFNYDAMRSDIKTIAEVQISQHEQNEIRHQEIIQIMNEKTSVIENAVTRISSDRDSIFEVLGEHEVSIRNLKKKIG